MTNMKIKLFSVFSVSRAKRVVNLILKLRQAMLKYWMPHLYNKKNKFVEIRVNSWLFPRVYYFKKLKISEMLLIIGQSLISSTPREPKRLMIRAGMPTFWLPTASS